MKKITLLALSLFLGITMNAQIVLTQSTSNTITGANSVGCPSGDNSWARNFILANYSVDPASAFVIGSGEFGVQSNTIDGIATIKVFASDANFPTSFGSATLLGTQAVTVPALSDESIISFDFDTPVVVPAGTVAVLYTLTTVLGFDMFIGGSSVQTASGYLLSGTCGVTTYTTPTDIGFPDAKFYMTLTGDILGVSENVLAANMLLYPNPTNGNLNIRFSKNVGTTNIDVLTLTGQKVLSVSVDGFGTNSIATSELASGVYLAKVSTENESTTVKFVKN